MAERLFDNEDWLVGVRLISRDPETGAQSPAPVAEVEFHCTFHTEAGAVIGAATVTVADENDGRLFLSLPRQGRAPIDFGEASFLSVFADLQAVEEPPSPVTLRTRGRISALVFRGY